MHLARRPVGRVGMISLAVVYVLGVGIAALLMGHGLNQNPGHLEGTVLATFAVAALGALYCGVAAITRTAERRSWLWAAAAMTWLALAAAFVSYSGLTSVVKS